MMTDDDLLAEVRRLQAELGRFADVTGRTTRRALMTDLTDRIDVDLLDSRRDVSWGVCVDGILHVATRWEDTCRCGQPISSGAVGLATWCDSNKHAAGGYNHQHSCGAWNSPAEVAVKIDDTDNDAAEIALARLDAEVAAERTASRDAIRDALRRDLAAFLAAIDGVTDPDEIDGIRSQLGPGDELTPGIYREDGRWIAWDDDPTRPGDVLTVYPDGL